jgi:CxxC-x17-CxxC domain-containing protein
MENSKKGGFGKGGNGGGFRKPGGFNDRKTFARPSFGGDRSDFKKKPWDSRGGKSFNNDDRQMFSATCSECGKSCQVPFMPSSGKPVFCDECFSKARNNDAPMRNNSSSNYNDRAPRAAAPSVNTEALTRQMEAISTKLDTLIGLMSVKAVSEKKSVAPVEEIAVKKVVVKDTGLKAAVKKAVKTIASAKVTTKKVVKTAKKK